MNPFSLISNFFKDSTEIIGSNCSAIRSNLFFVCGIIAELNSETSISCKYEKMALPTKSLKHFF